jgi:replicative DNA helicase
MKFTAPVFILKQHARVLARKEKIPLHQALDRIASREGFNSWSLLAAKAASEKPSERFLGQLSAGDLALIAARPGQGKTLFSLRLAVETMKQGNRAAFFTLEFTEADVARCFEIMDEKLSNFTDRLLIDDSDQICADYIATRLASAPAKMLVIIDYLQLLDQKRLNASIADQIQRLKDLARERQLIIVCLSQIDRRFDVAKQPFPGFGDVRLPNPLDIGLFNHACFLNRGRLKIGGQPPNSFR